MFGLLQVTVRCSDIPLDELADAVREVQEDFRKYRPWHRNVRCDADGTALILRAQNDFDEDGDVLCDELAACLREQVSAFGPIEVLAVEPLPDPPSAAAMAVPRPERPAPMVHTRYDETAGHLPRAFVRRAGAAPDPR